MSHGPGQTTNKTKILVVEDNADMNRFIVECLSQDYQVISAFDGRQGIERALAFKPALIVSDIMMPVVSGVEMIAELRKRPEMVEIPILLLSAKADEGLKAQLLENGAQDFITKPFTKRELLVRIRNLVAVQQVKETLREADRRKDDFIALLAHELRNPLAPIRNGLHVIGLAGNDVNAVGQARSMMDRQLGHMVRLIDDLMDISRISRNKMDLRLGRVALAEVIRSAVETSKPLIDARGHKLIVSIPEQPVYLDADLTRLAQVFSNLLNNSAKYTMEGGRIWFSVERRDNKVVVHVRDTGIGIPSECLPTIFDMFSQVDRSIERTSGGLGIGLALVKGIVEMHGGTVTAESPGQGLGSLFTIILPTQTSLKSVPNPSAPDGTPSTAEPKRTHLNSGRQS